MCDSWDRYEPETKKFISVSDLFIQHRENEWNKIRGSKNWTFNLESESLAVMDEVVKNFGEESEENLS